MNCALMYSTPVQQATTNAVAGYQQEVYNEVETVFELVTEEWLDIENCVPEQDTEDGRTDFSKVKTFDWYKCIGTVQEQPVYVVFMAVFSEHKQPGITPVELPLSTPPPDVA